MPEKTYEWNAADYARNSAGQFSWAQELIGKLRLRGDEAVLDIGCGDGKISAGIARLVPDGRVIGVDLSRNMVALARERFCCGPEAQPNLAFAQMDAAALGFATGFEVAFSNAVLHWVRDHRPVLTGVTRCLKPGGRLLFQMGGPGNAAEVIRAFDTVRNQEQWRKYFRSFQFPYRFYPPEEYQALLREAGLRERRVELFPKDMTYTGRDTFTGWVRTAWMPYTEPVPAENREAYLRAVVDTYLEWHPQDADGTIHVGMMRLEVEAEKE